MEGVRKRVIMQWYVGWWKRGLLLEFAKRTMLPKNATFRFTRKSREGGMRTGTTALFMPGRGSAAMCDVRQCKHKHVLGFVSFACR